MRDSREIVAWQPVLTDHQIYTLSALRDLSGYRLTVYVLELEDDRRAAQGWTAPDTAACAIDLSVIPRRKTLRKILHEVRTHRQSIHIFGSPFDRPKMMIGLVYAGLIGARVYLISEPYSPIAAGYLSDTHRVTSRLKAKLRPWLYKLYGLVLRRRISGVFAISALAVTQYREIGIPKDKIFPFGYFVPTQIRVNSGTARDDRQRSRELRVVCVANLIQRKGISDLIAAVSALLANNIAITAEFYGAGDPARFEFRAPEIAYAGVIPFGQTQQVVAQFDLLVLPSKYDGWGVVVNEALMAGVPVLCSDRVGASGVIKKWKCGSVYSLAEKGALELALSDLAADPTKLHLMRRNAVRAAAALQPAIAARYMTQVLHTTADQTDWRECPWYDTP